MLAAYLTGISTAIIVGLAAGQYIVRLLETATATLTRSLT